MDFNSILRKFASFRAKNNKGTLEISPDILMTYSVGIFNLCGSHYIIELDNPRPIMNFNVEVVKGQKILRMKKA